MEKDFMSIIDKTNKDIVNNVLNMIREFYYEKNGKELSIQFLKDSIRMLELYWEE